MGAKQEHIDTFLEMKQMAIESKKMFGVLIVLIMLYIMPVGMARAAQVGDTFSDEGGNITYEVTSAGYTKTCAVTGWKSECVKVIIPEKVVYDKTEYAVTEIKPKYTAMITTLNELEIPKTVNKLNISLFSFSPLKDEAWKSYGYKDGIKFVFKCSPSAFKDMKEFSVYADAISSRIQVPEEYLTEYKALFDGKTHCMFSDNDIAMREYTGIPLVAISDMTTLPEGFICDGSYYKILDGTKRTASLLKKPMEMNPEMNGTVYEQPSRVNYKGVNYTVTKIEYYAFCDAHRGVCYAVKLPSTISSLASKSFGWQVTSLDLSETNVKTIPSNLFNTRYDEYGYSPKVKSVILPDTSKTISKNAFYRCKKLKSIKLPASVKNIGKKAFSSKLKAIYLLGDSIPSGLEMQNLNSVKIYVKENIVSATQERLKTKIENNKWGVLKIK